MSNIKIIRSSSRASFQNPEVDRHESAAHSECANLSSDQKAAAEEHERSRSLQLGSTPPPTPVAVNPGLSLTRLWFQQGHLQASQTSCGSHSGRMEPLHECDDDLHRGEPLIDCILT